MFKMARKRIIRGFIAKTCFFYFPITGRGYRLNTKHHPFLNHKTGSMLGIIKNLRLLVKFPSNTVAAKIAKMISGPCFFDSFFQRFFSNFYEFICDRTDFPYGYRFTYFHCYYSKRKNPLHFCKGSILRNPKDKGTRIKEIQDSKSRELITCERQHTTSSHTTRGPRRQTFT